MSDEQIRQTKLETIERYSELKTRKAALESQITKWKNLFQGFANGLQSPMNTHLGNSDFSGLPTGDEVKSALAELRDVTRDLAETKKLVADMGLGNIT